MNKIIYTFIISLLLIFLSCKTEKKNDYSTVEQDINSIRTLMDSVMAVSRKGDLEAYLSLYTDDALWMTHDRLEDAGKEEVRDYYSWINDYTFDQKLTINEIEIAGDWAFIRFTADGWILPKPSVEGERERVISRHFTIASRQADGSWKLARDMFINPRIKDY
jgi:uncharacterized protein (TIGR02246 family)